MQQEPNLQQKLKNLVIGKSRSPRDTRIFHKLSLIAFFAWVGLGADGLSSSCYGPQEAFLALGHHPYLAVFVAIATALTVFVISASYSQIVELFPTGGGGYLVASKLLSPGLGMLSGCALLIDYVLTIAVSIASGTDALCSLLPLKWQSYRLSFAVCIVLLLTLMNTRGVKESILPLVPIFLAFLFTHVFVILYAVFTHLPALKGIAASTGADVHSSISEVGFWGMFFLIVRAYSMGAGTYTGIEAVSNGIPVLREPRAETARHTMRYMAFSLAFMVLGLALGYLIYGVTSEPGKTLNAILFERATQGWNTNYAVILIFVALMSEATLLFVAAQTGFLDGPRVLANMSLDRWFPTKFSALSDRLVIQKGILIMGGLSLVIMIISKGSVRFLVVLYSINVFITFALSQLGMVRHWWNDRFAVRGWRRKLFINGIGLVLTVSILAMMIIFKFFEGGWITLLITGALVVLAILIKRHYHSVWLLLRRLDNLVTKPEFSDAGLLSNTAAPVVEPKFDPNARTAVLLVSGFNGMGLHTLFNVMRLFGGVFKNFVFVQVGVIDVGNFKGAQEVGHLESQAKMEVSRYVNLMRRNGLYAEGISEIGVDIVDEVMKITPNIIERFPSAIFFGGQLVFEKDSFVHRFLHNHIVFSLQRRLYHQGIPFVILPIRVY
ncbi:MAG: APC family permease [Sedimentisphaerales bacterium]|jgi:amino acid transporter